MTNERFQPQVTAAAALAAARDAAAAVEAVAPVSHVVAWSFDLSDHSQDALAEKAAAVSNVQ